MYQIDAFTDRPFSGNPAAVVLLRGDAPASAMQALAAENNLSETAFVRAMGANWSLRWFTPTAEVSFCGHATLAAAHALMVEEKQAGPVRFVTAVGDLTVTAEDEGFTMRFPRFDPEPLDAGDPRLASALGRRPVAAFQARGNLFAVLPDEGEVRRCAPNMAAVEGLPDGLCVTAPAVDVDFASRYFAPSHGIPEDPVTGSIHATLAPYWAGETGRTSLEAVQASARGGSLRCTVKEDAVEVWGQAVTVFRAELAAPVVSALESADRQTDA
jgi:PhzF family phenazine biosynthesis protein